MGRGHGDDWRADAAWRRLGYESVQETFTQIAGPVATEDTPGAFPGAWREMSMDGLEWDIPDTESNAAAFGYPAPARTLRGPRFPRPGR
jgi:hypothetical protein